MKSNNQDKSLKISIITVCFNSSKTIRRTIESVLNQNYENIEYIIVDGNSTDDTLGIVKEFKNIFKEKLIISCEPDKGVYDAINKGINLASGDIVNILSSNDWLCSNILIDVADYFKHENSIDILHGNIIMEKKIGENIYTGVRKSRGSSNLSKSMTINHPSCFIKSDWYAKIKYNIFYKIAGDHDFMLKSYKMGANFRYIDKEIMVMTLGGLSNSFKTILESYHILRSAGYIKNACYYLVSRTYKTFKSIILRYLGSIILSSKRFENIEINKWNKQFTRVSS